MADIPSSPPGASSSREDALAWYKAQYEQLESELTEFKESSMELEKELEKDIEDAEKRERTLQDRAEDLAFQVEEWKVGAACVVGLIDRHSEEGWTTLG